MRWKLILNIITFAALGLILYFAREDITTVFKNLGSLNLWVLLLMVPVQFLVFYAMAKVFYYFFNASGTALTTKQLFSPMMELNFVNHVLPSVGISGFTYLTLRLKPLGVTTAKSTLAQLARFAFVFIGFIGLMLISLILLAADGKTNSLIILIVSAVTFSMIFGTGILVFIIGRESRISWFAGGFARFINRLVGVFRPGRPEVISLDRVHQTFSELHKDYILVRQNAGRMKKVIMWAVIVDVLELVLLYLTFVAHGAWVNPGIPAIGFVTASLAGLFAILPGGLGVYEPLMTAVFISTGVPAALALSATLVYRVVTLIISLLSGYVLYQKAIARYGKDSLSSQ